MKTTKMLFKRAILMIVLLALAVIMVNCSKTQDELVTPAQDESLKIVNIDNTGSESTPIYAGQTTEVGSILLEDDFEGQTLTVTYTTTGGWEMTEIHFAVKGTSSAIPTTKKGNLIPGQFEFSFSFPEGVTTHTFMVPFSAFGGTECGATIYYAAAHSVVRLPDGNGGYLQTETGWGNGSLTPGNSWGEIFTFQMLCEEDPDGDGDEPTEGETAFAYGCEDATCFLDIQDEDGQYFNRWGWSNELEEIGTYYFDIYAAAGQCNLTSGTLVGELVVVYDGAQAVVTFNTCGGYSMDETHLYVGSEILPRNNGDFTVAPGKFPYMHEELGGATTDTYTVTGLSGTIYVVAHAVVVGDYSQGDCGEPGCDFEEPCVPAGIIYGTNVGYPENIYQINLSDQTLTLVKDVSNAAGDGNYPNGLAWDENNNRFIFAEENFNATTNPNVIYYYTVGDAARTQLTTAYASGTPVLTNTLPINSGAWYDGKYYFINYNTNRLYEGVVDVTTNTITLTLLYTLPQTFGFFGDIVFDPETPGLLIGWGATGAGWTYFTVDITTGAYNSIRTGTGNLRQLAFGYTASGWVLYGADANTGGIYSIDKLTGIDTYLFTVPGSVKFTDLASGPQCQ